MKRIYFLIIFVILSTIFSGISYAQETKDISSVTITHNTDNPPFKFVNDKGESDGILIDVWKLWSEKTGIKVKFVPATWDNTLKLVKDGKVDIHAGLFSSEERSKHLDFTSDLSEVGYDYFIERGCYNQSLKKSDITAYKVGVSKGFTASFVKKNYPDQTIEIFENYPELFKNAIVGKIKVFVAPKENLEYCLFKNQLNNQFVKLDFIKGYKKTYLGAVKKNNNELLRVINLGLNKISEEEIDDIVQNWLSREKKTYSFVSESNGFIKFTEKEKQWLEENKEITFGADFNWPPFDFADKNDKHSGLSSEYIKIIEKHTGTRINVMPGVWSYILNQAKTGKIDGITAAVKTSEREEYLKFSEPFIEVPLVIITKSNREDIKEFNDLKDRIIAVNKGSYIHEYILKQKLDVYLALRFSNKECLKAVSYGKADVYIGNLSAYTNIAEKEMITNLKVVDEMPEMSAPISIAVTDNNITLQNIINKVLNNISDVEHKKLRDKWFAESLLSECEIIHTKREHEWIMEHPVIRIAGEPNWAPLSYYNNKGNYVGVVPDIWKLIEKRGGAKVKRVRSESWSHTISMFENNEIDIIEAITPTEKRREFADFTDVYLKVDYVIITRTDVNYIKNFKSLDLTTIGVVEGYEVQEHITKQFPNQKLLGFESTEEGLKALSYGEIYAFIIDVASFEFYSKKNGLSNIKISGASPFFYETAIAVRKGNRELISILNKTLKTITDEEYKELFNRWSTINEPLIDYSLVWKVVLSAIVVLIFIFYWNRRLSNEVALRKKTEIELMKAKNIAEEATNAKSEFLANMSHEIRTPMNAVIGFSELLQQTPLTHKQESYLATIVSGGHTLLSLINDILDISKIEANKLEILYSSFDIVSTIYEIEQFFDERLKVKGLQLLFEQDPSFRSYIILDENRLRQILFNLVSNSIKFTNSGYIKLTTKFTEIENEVHKMEIVIEDTGIGIKASQLPKIFDSFVQVGDLKTKRNIKGTGLGLSITKRLVELMNGSITVESELKKGTKFVIEFMDVKTEKRSDYGDIRSKDSGIITFDKAKVLIVDDVESNRLLLKEICEDHGFEIYEAENGEESIAKAKLYVPDMILMDIRMPVMDGYEAITLLKKDPNLKRIPVIAVTASVMSRESDKLKEYKFDGYLRKPILRKEILNKFKEFIHYTIDENEGTKTTLVNDELVEGDNFLIELNGTLYEQYKNSVEKHNLDDIMQFAKDLYELAEKHHSSSIMDYSKEMEIAVKNFDISTIKNLLVKYEGMIKVIET